MRVIGVYLFAALLSLSSYVDAVRVLGLFPHTGKSHQMVFEPLLRRLAERGHHVTVVSFFPLENPPANYTDVSLQGIAKLGLESVDLAYCESPSTIFGALGLERVIIQLAAFHPLADMAVDVCKKLVEWAPLKKVMQKDYDVILVENFNSDCMLGLTHVYGIKAPIVAMLSSGLMPWSHERIGVTDNPAYVPTISTAYGSPMTFLDRMQNTFEQLYLKFWYRYKVQFKEQEVIEKHFGRKIPDLNDLGKNTSLMLINTFHSFNGRIPFVPGLIEVGGMHLVKERQAIPCNIERFLNESEHGVILFSFGSLIKTSTIPKHKEEIIVNALSQFKQRVIWKYEDSDEEGTLNGNILRVRWIPQYELLRHKKVQAFIAHGGLLGMTEALSAGKPMLVVPFFGDQPLNGASAATAGFAKVLSYGDLTEKSITEALRSVLSAEMRLSARRASKIWQDRQSEPLDTAVYWVERVARWGAEAPLHSPARDLTFIQYALLDVAAAYIVTILALIVVLRFTLSQIFNYINASFNKEGKKKVH